MYHQFFKVIESAGRKVIHNKLKVVAGQYQMDFEDMERKLKTLNMKAILLCNPHNPVGRVWTKPELQKLVDLANKYNVTIISDEIHSGIVYSKSQFNSIASLTNSENHITVLGSPAKTFGMQSISNGYLYIPNKETHKQVKNTTGSLYLDHGNILSANATIAAYTKGEEWLDDLLVYLEKTMQWIENFMQMNYQK
ncbi:aminotransferase class I/II-fold pyridoxal phosphate-dependent enzyme [Polaribacter sejongensis]|uniref:aminotransferase class I/II-fold pyridoxal phosphate-dependent enzyme n=1 Tax=Polaribacter sejongensis TaxID=985043 RepID=UPI0035A68A2D